MDATATDRHAERVEHIYQAADVLREDQDEQTRRVVDWLAGWDDHTVNGVVKLLANARVCAVLDVGRRVADVMDSGEQRADRPRLNVLREGERTIIDNPIGREELEERPAADMLAECDELLAIVEAVESVVADCADGFAR